MRKLGSPKLAIQYMAAPLSLKKFCRQYCAVSVCTHVVFVLSRTFTCAVTGWYGLIIQTTTVDTCPTPLSELQIECCQIVYDVITTSEFQGKWNARGVTAPVYLTGQVTNATHNKCNRDLKVISSMLLVYFTKRYFFPDTSFGALISTSSVLK